MTTFKRHLIKITALLIISFFITLIFQNYYLHKNLDLFDLIQPKNKTKSLTYIIGRANEPVNSGISLSPEQSNNTDNGLILKTLIGTLVRYSPTGLIEPSLAKHWSISSDNRTWKFELRPNLKCEDGEVISANSFSFRLKKSFLNYLKNSKSIMTFNQLKGWDEFVKTGKFDSLGINATDDNILTFEFNEKVDDVLDILSTVYFGYWCSGNFKNDQFQTETKLISSGPYVLEKKEEGLSIYIKKSPQWYEKNSNEIEKIEFRAEKIKEKIGIYDKAIVRLGLLPPNILDKNNFNVVQIVPIYLTGIILSPFIKNGFFLSHKNRRIFEKRLRKLQLTEFFMNLNLHPSTFFYDNAPSSINFESNLDEKIKYNGEDLNIYIGASQGENVQELFKNTIYKLFPEIPKNKLHFNKFNFDKTQHHIKIVDNSYYDIRFVGVNIGEYISNSGGSIDMMFCTKLGVGLPDPSGEICKLSSSYSKKGKIVDDHFISRFNQIIYDDAVVIPYFHSGITYLYSKDINTSAIPSGIGDPIFERLEIN